MKDLDEGHGADGSGQGRTQAAGSVADRVGDALSQCMQRGAGGHG